jgi:hypothetical protein
MDLRPDRWKEIVGSLMGIDPGYFICHKTSDETGDGSRLVCAGSLAFQAEWGLASSYQQVCERLDLMRKGGVRMRRRFLITNETKYRTADLLRIARHAAREVFKEEEKPIVRIRLVYAGRRRYVTGCASLGGTMTTVRVGRGVTDVRMIAAVVVHEFGHLRGLDHPTMRGNAWWTWTGYPRGLDWEARTERWLRAHEWARNLPWGERTAKVRPKLVGMDLIEFKRARVEEGLARWTKKAKRAATEIAKRRRQLKYYDRRAAAMTVGG